MVIKTVEIGGETGIVPSCSLATCGTVFTRADVKSSGKRAMKHCSAQMCCRDDFLYIKVGEILLSATSSTQKNAFVFRFFFEPSC